MIPIAGPNEIPPPREKGLTLTPCQMPTFSRSVAGLPLKRCSPPTWNDRLSSAVTTAIALTREAQITLDHHLNSIIGLREGGAGVVRGWCEGGARGRLSVR